MKTIEDNAILIKYEIEPIVDYFLKEDAEKMFGKSFEQITEDDIKKLVNERIECGEVEENARENFEVKNFTIKIEKGSA